MLYTVGEMAKKLQVAPSTLRYYDKEGLLPFVERSSGGIRMFKENDYEWLKMIECLKKTGMHLKDIREFLYMSMQGDETIEPRLCLMQKQREEVKKQVAEWKEILETLEFKCWYYETAKEMGTTEALKSMKLEEVPQEFQAVWKKLKGV